VHVDTFGTAEVDEAKIIAAVKEIFTFKPADIVSSLNLLRPIYGRTTNYGHFGREDAELPWEKTDKAEELRSAVS